MSEDYVGQIVGVFNIVERMEHKATDRHALYRGICNECGFERIARISDFKETTRCTHIRVDGVAAFNKTKWNNARIKDIFNGMKQRCYNTDNKNYRDYGAKGIIICDEWMDDPSKFEEWSMNNGYYDNLVIYRVDKLGSYCPDNCMWVTNEYSQKRKLKTNLIKINGIEDSGAGWSIRLGFGRNYINKFIRKHGLEKTILCIQAKLDGDENAFGHKKASSSTKKKSTNKIQRQKTT